MEQRMKRGYGTWSSPLGPKQVAEASTGIGELRRCNNTCYWIESRPQEAGRAVIVRKQGDIAEDILPAPFSARSRVHEYGGGSYCVSENRLWFVNAKDQNIYEVSLRGPESIRQITKTADAERFADLKFDSYRESLIAVRELHSPSGSVGNDLVSVSIERGDVKIVHVGHDFYSSPAISPDAMELAFVAWDHPHMPWDGTQLYWAYMDIDGTLSNTKIVAAGSDESIEQPRWTPDGTLLFLSDRTGYWNLYEYAEDTGQRIAVDDSAEYGGPAWVFGLRSFDPVDDRFVVACRIVDGESELVMADLKTGTASTIDNSFATYESVHSTVSNAVFLCGSSTKPMQVVEMGTMKRTTKVLHCAATSPLEPSWIATGEAIEFPTVGGHSAHAYFYPPTNPDTSALSGEKPPLLVLSHGGPTARHDSVFNLGVQYYTSRGWAVLDVNYGGSTGHGREYRQRLEGNWGVVDVQDCEAGVQYLINQSLVDGKRVAIKGGSAGGYTTLRALTTSNIFKAGSSHYGIGDLRILASSTHKFESSYLDRLIPSELFEERSPILRIDALKQPVIFFQGADDQVVPLNQARMMFDALAQRGRPTALFVFEGEGHGFRVAKNREIAMTAELLFLSRVLGIEPVDLDDAVFEQAEMANIRW